MWLIFLEIYFFRLFILYHINKLTVDVNIEIIYRIYDETTLVKKIKKEINLHNSFQNNVFDE